MTSSKTHPSLDVSARIDASSADETGKHADATAPTPSIDLAGPSDANATTRSLEQLFEELMDALTPEKERGE
ncbi:hypothetical protein [Variovorax sp. J31P207]|uniref:hypothetical protein n=1 Tax=Variovorax sp. J31P207 TaxID=3053510 RepID=UPI0025788CBE|nr:hypothetical protein [Variovorax sp. J31P207]MDM0071458.1 hypothetical protein [Variovorax sp. J31P207]